MRKKLVLRIFVTTLLWNTFSGFSRANAADLLMTDNSLWFDATDRTEVKISAEIGNYSAEKLLIRLQASYGAKLKRSGEKTFVFGITENPLVLRTTYEGSEPYLILTGKKAFHRDIVRLNQILKEVETQGARSRSTEMPLAVRVHDLKNQDAFVANVTGVPVRTIRELDSAVGEKPLIFRYFLDDRRKTNPADYQELKPHYKDSILSYIPANSFGRLPLVVPGSSVIFHSRTFHGASVLGAYNPGLVNAQIAQALTANKFVEAKFWNEFAPGALPETHLLGQIASRFNSIEDLVDGLNKKFPSGWVMKGLNESNSNFSILTDKIDFKKEYRDYLGSDFEKYRAAVAVEKAGMDEDDLFMELQKHKNFLGWRISEYLQKPFNVIVQNRVQIDREFRIEVIAGRVLRGATIDRHNWLLKERGLPYEVSPPEIIAKAEAFTQSVVDKLPPHLRETNFAFDTALLKDGSFIAIETNAGSESGFLASEGRSAELLNDFLRTYPDKVKRGEISGSGLSPREQMRFLKEKFAQWKVDPSIQYPKYRFTETRIDTGFVSRSPHPHYKTAGPRCQALFAR